MAFLDDVSEGDVSRAKRFWKPEVWDEGIAGLVAGWATGEHEFSVGDDQQRLVDLRMDRIR
jgi:hypothetical protein